MALTQIACWLSHACFCWGTRKLWSQSSHPDWQLRLTWPKMLGLDASAVCPSPNSTTTSTADANDLLLAAGDRYNELIYRTGTACVTCSWRAASSLTSFIALFSAHHEYLYKPSVLSQLSFVPLLSPTPAALGCSQAFSHLQIGGHKPRYCVPQGSFTPNDS